jgi:hypothetical protein
MATLLDCQNMAVYVDSMKARRRQRTTTCADQSMCAGLYL